MRCINQSEMVRQHLHDTDEVYDGDDWLIETRVPSQTLASLDLTREWRGHGENADSVFCESYSYTDPMLQALLKEVNDNPSFPPDAVLTAVGQICQELEEGYPLPYSHGCSMGGGGYTYHYAVPECEATEVLTSLQVQAEERGINWDCVVKRRGYLPEITRGITECWCNVFLPPTAKSLEDASAIAESLGFSQTFSREDGNLFHTTTKPLAKGEYVAMHDSDTGLFLYFVTRARDRDSRDGRCVDGRFIPMVGRLDKGIFYGGPMEGYESPETWFVTAQDAADVPKNALSLT